MSDYFREASYGKVELAFEYSREMIAPRASSYYAGDLRRIAEDAIRIFDAEVPFSKYEHVLIIHNGDWRFASASIGRWPMQTDEGMLELGLSQIPEIASAGVVAHELYHNFGLWDLESPPHEVGPWDIMAEDKLVRLIHTLSYFKLKLGWLAEENLKIIGVGTVGPHEVYPLEFRVGQIKALKVSLGAKHYFIEARRKTEISRALPEEGVIISLVENVRGKEVVRVMNANPKTPTLLDAAYGVGEFFRSEEDNLHVEVLSTDESSFRLTVSFAALAPALMIETEIPRLPIRIDGVEYLTDENGRLSVRVWPGRKEISVALAVWVDNRSRLVFTGWLDGEGSASRIVEVTSDLTLGARYELRRLLKIRVEDWLGSPIQGASISVLVRGDVIETLTDETGEAELWLPEGERARLLVRYFGQEELIEAGPPEGGDIDVAVYGPRSALLAALAVIGFLVLLGAIVKLSALWAPAGSPEMGG